MQGWDVSGQIKWIRDHQTAAVTADINEAVTFGYGIGPQRDRLDTGADGPSAAELGAARKAEFTCRLPGSSPPQICFGWRDSGPGHVWFDRPGAGRTLEPNSQPWLRVVGQPGGATLTSRVKTLDGLKTVDLALDDRTSFFATRAHGSHADGALLWTTIFRPDADAFRDLEGKTIRIEASRAPAVDSEAFDARSLELCTPRRERQCALEE